MIKVLFICHGNICRSTMAESLFTYMMDEQGHLDDVVIDSAATSREEIGNPPHYGTVSVLRKHGIPVVPHRARQMTSTDYEDFDFLIGMDDYNISNMLRVSQGEETKIFKLLDFLEKDDKDYGRDVSDPWYTGKFDITYNDMLKGLTAFTDYLIDSNLL